VWRDEKKRRGRGGRRTPQSEERQTEKIKTSVN
jgi:hypothetical protein